MSMEPTTPTPTEVRARIIDALRLDLVGPTAGLPGFDRYAEEVLDQPPSRWYLTGFLAPFGTLESDPTSDDELDTLGEVRAGDDETTPEKAAARKSWFPSSMGLSVLVPKQTRRLEVAVRWGDYHMQKGDLPGEQRALPRWQRTAREEHVALSVLDDAPPSTVAVPESQGLELLLVVRSVDVPDLVPPGTRSLSVFLVNRRRPAPDVRRDEGYVFQPELILEADQPFVPRPDPRGQGSRSDGDEQIGDLQYRDAVEYAVGHNVSALAVVEGGQACSKVCTAWMPTADVERVVPGLVQGVELGMEALASAPTADAVREQVGSMVTAYGQWIEAQRQGYQDEPASRRQVGDGLLADARRIRDRMREGLAILDDPTVLEAFRIANRCVARAIRQRLCHGGERSAEEVAAPVWRPFQLAFLLTNLAGLVDPKHPDRQVVDLLFFPTGGGKTEAYLGLAAFTLALRRLRDPSIGSAGVAVLMRYTLRLLTLDQLGRAAALICALELERQEDVHKLGTWPFEIGLWVGQAATPNRMGRKGDKDEHAARKKVRDFQNDPGRRPSPIPLENCPWCGRRLGRDSFQLLPDADQPKDLRVFCENRDCQFHARRQPRGLPVLAVDEPLYRRLPCFVIATVDKFAGLPWVGETAGLFGRVDRCDQDGFYGPWNPGLGRPLPGPLPPPALVIQDELHLISGPLGTMVGLYETAVEALCKREVGTPGPGPKIVASTATVRRAQRQIRALFGRAHVDVFPPPGPDRRDSFFARTAPAVQTPPRTYLGVAAPGRNLKVVMLRTALALLGAAQKEWLAAGGHKNPANPADPYMTLMAYFNSLRELGGARRIVEDEVLNRVADYGRRVRVGEKEGLFANRPRVRAPRELTSRVSTNEVAETKRMLELSFQEKECVDVALATNMISVGLDITRLGLMLVLGQPKAAAEYIQATSRVGRHQEKPGLVVTLLNVHRPRDRSHYERFRAWHESFYRAVEATSVTPFSPRALDRGLAAVTVALARLGHSEMVAPRGAVEAARLRHDLDRVAKTISRRAEQHDGELSAEEADRLRREVRDRVADLLDTWACIAGEKKILQYAKEVGKAPPLLFDPLDPELERQPRPARKFKAPRSLRDVEPTVNLWLRWPEEFAFEEGRS